MEYNLTKKIDKIILLILVLFMLLPSSTIVFNISIFKVEAIILCIITAYIFLIKNISFKEIMKNKFIICNLIFAASICLSIIVNYKTVLFNDLYEIIKYIVYPMITLIIVSTCDDKEKYNSMSDYILHAVLAYAEPMEVCPESFMEELRMLMREELELYRNSGFM